MQHLAGERPERLTFRERDDRFKVALDECRFDERQCEVQPVVYLLSSRRWRARASPGQRRVVSGVLRVVRRRHVAT